jgi:hypothetical protein
VHTEAAARHGASRDEIAEALGVATAVNAGAALVYSSRVLEDYEQHRCGRSCARHRQQPRDLAAWMFGRNLIRKGLTGTKRAFAPDHDIEALAAR